MAGIKCMRCPIMCGYGPVVAGMEELTDAPKNLKEVQYMRQTQQGYVDDLISFCINNYQPPSDET